MINQTELRVGNYIYNDENVIVKVERIDSTHYNNWNGEGNPPVLFSINGDIRESDVINPIRLTEEILLKCGFYWDIPVQKYCDGNWCIRLNHNGTFDISYIKSHSTFIPFWFGASPKYLHELQNIYYFLTKQELEINI